MTMTTEPAAAAPDGAAAIATAAPWAPPAGIAELFGRPLLAHSEDADAYEAWLRRVARAVGPQDIFEWVLLRDYADLAWEVLRLRRAKGGILRRARSHSLTVFVAARGGLETANKLFTDPALERAALLLMGMDADGFAASVTADVLDALEQVERLIAAAEARREAMLERIDDHRQSPGERVRKAAAEVVDAEFEDLPGAATPARPSATSAA